jgi:signal peptidase I
VSDLVLERPSSGRPLGRGGRFSPARARSGLHAGATAVAWLYLYALLWLGAYTVLSTLVFGWTPVLITGGSMRPGISPGDLVMLAEVEGPAGRGAVLTFRAADRDGAVVTHRVEAVLPEGYRTRGDANATADPQLVDHADVVGVGRLLVPALGRTVLWVNEGEWLPLAAWVAGTSVALVLAGPRLGRSEAESATAAAAPAPAVKPAAEPAPDSDGPTAAWRSPSVTVLPSPARSRAQIPTRWIPRPRTSPEQTAVLPLQRAPVSSS